MLIRKMLADLVPERFVSDQRYRNGHIRVINPVRGREILGVHVPDMKALAKQLSKREDAIDVIRRFKTTHDSEPFSLCYEELVVWGLMINAVKVSWDVREKLLLDFIPAIDNWGVCDTFCADAKWGKDKARLWEFLGRFRQSDREFELRFAVIMSMCYLLDDEYFPKVCAWLDSVNTECVKSSYIPAKQVDSECLHTGMGVVNGEVPYYVNMAVAWFLATALAKMPVKTREYLESCSLPQIIMRLYVRKAKESFRTRNIEPFNG